MSMVAETATLAHGFTMADVEALTRTASWGSTRGRMLDASDRWDYAWHAIVEHLYTTEQRPTNVELVRVGMNALQAVVAENLHHHGSNLHTFEVGPQFGKYWLPVAGTGEDFTDRLIERMALPQVLGQLTAGEYEAIAALAVHGSQPAAADALGITISAMSMRLRTARQRILTVWLEGETPPRVRKADLEKVCRNGHDRATHSDKDEQGNWRCRRCQRNGARRRSARER